VASLANFYVCVSIALRPRALRPQLKRDPLGSTRVELRNVHDRA